MTVVLHGYRFSVYRRIALLALVEKGVTHTCREVDPFTLSLPEGYLSLQPFGRVPVLDHDGFTVYETAAIIRYIGDAFDGPALQPPEPKARARMQQIISVSDNYGYWPMVRQVFAHGYFRARTGRDADPAEVEAGLTASVRVLDALEALAGQGPFLVGDALTLADIHLAPMVAYFVAVPRAAAMLGDYAALSRWWGMMAGRGSMGMTAPG